MRDRQFVKRFRYAERPGLYCRVIQEGSVQAGDACVWKETRATSILRLEMFRDFYEPKRDGAPPLRRFLAAPVAIRDRVYMEAEFEKAIKKA